MRERERETEREMDTKIQPTPLVENNTTIGVELKGVGGGPVALAKKLKEGDENLAKAVADALRSYLVVVIRNEGQEKSGTLSPKLIRIIHECVHAARFPGLTLKQQPARSGWTSQNIRGSSFPGGYTETQLLGSCDRLDDLYGLSGSLKETAHWTQSGGQFHPDGAFDGGPPPCIVGMTCEEAPTEAPPVDFKTYGRFGPGDDWEKEEPTLVSCPAGATLFFPTLVSHMNPLLLERARRMRCVYIESFARILPNEWPVMSDSALTPTTNSPVVEMRERASTSSCSSSVAGDDEEAYRSFWCERQATFEGGGEGGGGGGSERTPYVHRLVQSDPMGEDFVVAHTLCLDHLEEMCRTTGEWHALTWQESQAFLEVLLRPASQRLLMVDWKQGDLCLWDNLRTLHSVTPRDAYELVPKARRVMTRTSMRPVRNVLH